MTPRPLAQLARTALDSTANATALAAAGSAMLLADRALPATWPRSHRVLTCGAIGLIAAISADGLAETAFAPARRQLSRAINPVPNSSLPSLAALRIGTEGSVPLEQAVDLEQLLVQLDQAAAEDAAVRAARGAVTLDVGEGGDGLLRHAERWAGRSDGEATFFLAPGMVLHYTALHSAYGRTHRYTLLRSDTDQPEQITSLAQLRLIVAARAAGRPAATAHPEATNRRSSRPAPMPEPVGPAD